MAKARQRLLDCEEHGASPAWMVCRHLREGRRRLGYHHVEAEPARSFIDAVLCNACAKLLLAEDAWTERLSEFADWKLYCEQCWLREKRKRGHRLVSRGRSAPESP